MKILLTGYTGFLGSHLLQALKRKHEFILLGRKPPKGEAFEHFYAEMSPDADFKDAVNSCDLIIHAAALTHIKSSKKVEQLSTFRRVNTETTIKLAEQAAKAGVKRFIFISSIKVNGESTTGRGPFTVDDASAPEEPYGISKAEAESQLFHISKKTGMEVVIIRPPIIYGAGVKGNFASLMNFIKKGMPSPFRSISDNRRSLVSVYNLIDLINVCIVHPKAANQVFLISDNQDLSTSELVALMAKVLRVTNISIPISSWCYKIVGKMLNKREVIDRLVGSLQIDISHTTETLGWKPPYTVEASLSSIINNRKVTNDKAA